VLFMGDAPTAGTDVFAINADLHEVVVDCSTDGWLATWSSVPVACR